MLEKSVQGTVVNKAEAAGWFVRPMQWRNRVGAPDYLFIKDGRVVFIEFKKNGGGEEKMQKRERKRMQAAGSNNFVCDRIEDALPILGL